MNRITEQLEEHLSLNVAMDGMKHALSAHTSELLLSSLNAKLETHFTMETEAALARSEQHSQKGYADETAITHRLSQYLGRTPRNV